MDKLNVSVIGLGQMGAALARAYLQKDARVTVWNRSTGKATPLVEQGAELAPDLETAITASDLIIVCVADYATSDSLLKQPHVESLLKGRTLVQLTTGTRADAERSARWAADAGFQYLDGAIMDYPVVVGSNECLLLASGAQAVYERHEQALKVLGGRFTYVGEQPGAANVLDGGLLTIYYASAIGFMQSAGMMMAEHVTPETLKHALDAFKPVIDRTFEYCTDRISRREYAGTEASVHVHTLGVKSLLSRAKSAGIEHGLLQLFVDYLEKANEGGHEADELPAVFEAFRPRGTATV
jgi:3-hydroxyisobutyrate dehydrogenase-like beta-hydroxyacid dehydrogenase